MVNERQQLLKYTRLGADDQADAPLILARDEAACFAASEKFHALGCSNGAVYILDFQGNKVRIQLRDQVCSTIPPRRSTTPTCWYRYKSLPNIRHV